MFKNLTVVHLAEPNEQCVIPGILDDREAFEEFCANHVPRDPESMVQSITGIAPVKPFLLDMLYDTSLREEDRFLPIKLVTYSRVVDNQAVKLAVKRRAAVLAKKFSRVVSRKELADLKHEVIAEMLPNAPIKETVCEGYITFNGDIYIGAVGKPAENFLKFFGVTFNQYITPYGEILAYLESGPTDYPINKYMLNRVIFPSELVVDIENMFGDAGDKFAFEATGDFSYNLKSESVAVKDQDLTDITDEIEHRWKESHFTSIELDNKDYRFTLLSNMTFKNIEVIGNVEAAEGDSESLGIHRTNILMIRDLGHLLTQDIIEANQDRYNVMYGVHHD